MRNLAILRDSLCSTPASEAAESHSTLHPRLACVDSDTSNIYIADAAGFLTCLTGNKQVLWTLNLKDTPGEGLAVDSYVTDISFVQELEALCVTATQGELLLVHSNKDVEEIGNVQEGITCSAWSPDEEILTLCTPARQVVLMSREWDILAEESMDALLEPDNDLAEALLENAGLTWRGDGKYFATVSSKGQGEGQASTVRVWTREGELQSVGKASGLLHPTLAWQPNGRHLYAACSTGSCHRVVLYETNGLEHGGFEVPTAGDLTQLSWSSNSELLAVVFSSDKQQQQQQQQQQPAVARVQIWHRSNWHWYLKQEQVYEGRQALHVYWDQVVPLRLHVVSSSAWYRQMDLAMDRLVSSKGTAVVVDGARLLVTPLQRALVPPPICAAAAHFPASVYCCAFGQHNGNEVLAAVTSARQLALVQAKEGDLWEPSSEEELDQLEEQGLQMGVLHPQTVALQGILADKGLPRLVVFLNEDSLSLLVIATAQPEAGGAEEEHRDILQQLTISWPEPAQQPEASITECFRAPGQVLCAEAAAEGGAVLQMQDGSLWSYQGGGLEGLTPLGPSFSFPVACSSMLPTPLAALQQLGPGTPPAVGLSEGGQLYWGPSPIQGGCTSVTVRGAGPGGPFLLYTTRDNTLHTVPFSLLGLQTSPTLAPSHVGAGGKGAGPVQHSNLHAAMHAAMRPKGAQQAKNVTVRAIEQGAKLVACPALGLRAVLQMPRGNLEGVCPRVLVLAGIAAHLQAHQYGEAFELTSNNRVDLNVIVDYAWPDFLTHAADFVQEVQYDQDVVDLLASLKPGSVASEGGLYAAALPPPPPAPAPDTPPEAVETSSPYEKIGAVAEALRAALLASDKGQGHFLRAILTSHVVVGDLEGALALIKQVKESQLATEELQHNSRGANGQQQQHASPDPGDDDDDVAVPLRSTATVTAEQGLKHLLLTVDVERLYRTALGMYDVQLAYMVVAHSQRDPGEYLLELQQLVKAPSENLRRHAMDMHLKRFPSALQHLVAAGDNHFQQALQLARAKGLLRELLQLVGEKQEQRREVLAVYGESLGQRNLQEDSALAFMAAQDLPRALLAYKAAGHYQMVLTLAGRLGYDEAQVRRLAAELVDGLSSLGNLAGAATVAVQYLADIDNGVSLLTQAREWREALRVSYKHARDDLVDTVIAPASAEAAATAVSDIRENRERVGKYLARLKEVRRKRSAMQAALAHEEDDAGVSGRDFDDTASEASSTVGGMSAYAGSTAAGSTTTASSRRPTSTVGGKKPSKRKPKKDKSGRIRQGSPEEERALGLHILALAVTPKQLTEGSQLAELLTLLGHEGDARVLQQQLSNLVNEQQEAQQYVKDNPPPEIPAHEQQQLAKPTNASNAAVDWKWDILRPVSLAVGSNQ